MSDKFMIGANELPTYVEKDIAELKPWEDNPRNFKEKDLDRLIAQIKLLGVYKPFLINQDNIVLGGHRRLQALQKLGVKRVSCSLVKTDNKAQMMDYALSDNDQIGTTDEAKVIAFITEHGEVKSELFAINSSPMKLVSSVLDTLKPNDNQKEKANDFAIKIAFNDIATLELVLVEVQQICEKYTIRGISVNDGNKTD